MNFISQKNQDEWVIDHIFKYKKNGFFIDLACADGVNINNTYLLEKELNWDGLCIEPNPRFLNTLTKNRTCKIVNECVDYKNHTIDFRVDNGMGGGIIAEDTDNNHKIRKQQLTRAKIIKMEAKTLGQILDENQAPKIIDYMSLDVEGAETRIMRNFPFNKYKFLSLTIERPTPELNKILFNNGYLFVRNSESMSKGTPYDSFYIHKDIDRSDIKKFPFSQVPKKNW